MAVGTALRTGATDFLHPLRPDPFCHLSIADTERSPSLAVKGAVLCPQIQIAVIEQYSHRDGADLGLLMPLSELLMQGMEQPSPFLLHLGGEGEAVILLRHPFPVFLYQPADTDPPDHGRGNR